MVTTAPSIDESWIRQLSEKRKAGGQRRSYTPPSAQVGVAKILVAQASRCGNSEGRMVPVEVTVGNVKTLFTGAVGTKGYFVYNNILSVADGKEYPVYRNAKGNAVVHVRENGKDLVLGL